MKKSSRESYVTDNGDIGEDDDDDDSKDEAAHQDLDVEESEEDVMSPPSGVNADDFDTSVK